MSHSTARVEAFSDGVFAIAITLLILDIKVPPHPETLAAASPADASRWLLSALAAEWTTYVAYVMSFVVILVMWVNHHRIFTVLERVDQPFLFWNGLLLLLVSVVPFPTSLVSSYFTTPAARVGAAVYAGHGLAIALAFQGVWQYAIRHPRLLAPGADAEVARMGAQYRYGPLMYLAAFGLAFVSAWAGMGLCLLFAAFFSLSGFIGKEAASL
jgi:uncharacterized membrane protein